MEKFVEERLIVRWIGVLHQWTIDNTDTQITGKTQSLLNEVENNIDGFPGSAYEAQRVADFAEADDVTQVTIEPAPAGTSFDQIDLRVSTQGEAGDTYIELKRAQTEERNDFTDHYEQILDRLEQLEKESENYPEDYREHEKDYEAQAKALLAIRRGNRDEFIEAIELWFDYLDPILESKRRSPPSDKDPIHDRVDITASALIALARQHGLDVRVNHDVVPEALYNEEYYPRGE